MNAVSRGGEFSSDEGTVVKCEMDSHADTCVAGPNFVILEFTGEQCDVTPYTNDYKPITNVSVVNAGTAYTDEATGVTVILRFNQILWYGKRMKMSLINPNQLRHYGIEVCDDPTDKNRHFGITYDDEHTIPFQMEGTTVYFETRAPTTWELQNCKVITVTDENVWDTSTVTISRLITNKSDVPMVELMAKREIMPMTAHTSERDDGEFSDLTPFDEAKFIQRMVGSVQVASAYRESNIAFVGSKNRHSQVTAETVARTFRCGIVTAQRTLKTTTQRGGSACNTPFTPTIPCRSPESQQTKASGHVLHGHAIFKSEIVKWKHLCTVHYKWFVYSCVPNGFEVKHEYCAAAE